MERLPDGTVGGRRDLLAVFEFEDRSVLKDHAKLITISDLLFGNLVLAPAEKRSFEFATIGLVKSETAKGDATALSLEDFRYARRDDAVWLRQAGSEAWKVAQDPAFTPPAFETVDLGSAGKVEVSFVGEIEPPKGLSRAFAIEMRSDTPIEEHERKYQEVRAFWGQLKLEKLKADGFDFADIHHFTERARGVFHLRRAAHLKIKRPAGEDWPTLPAKMPVPGESSPVIAWAMPQTEGTTAQLSFSKDAAAGLATHTVSLDVDDDDGTFAGAAMVPLRGRAVALPASRYLGGPQ
jgi:hypothetical protein